LMLEVDEFGNVLRSAAVGYGRRRPDPTLAPADQAKQRQTLVTYTENQVTNPIDAGDTHRTPLPCESRTYELTGLTPPPSGARFGADQISDAARTATEIDYANEPSAGLVQKRLIEHLRTRYRRDDLTGPLPPCVLQSRALPFESYQLAFTPDLIAKVYGTRTTDGMLRDEARYIHLDGESTWWTPSGRVFYSPDGADTPPEELAYARRHFFLPHRYRNPFHTDAVPTESVVAYDGHDLLVRETRDALGNQVTVGERKRVLPDFRVMPARDGNDYRVLQPVLVMDPNRNRSAVAVDALGMVAGTAVMGKPEDDPVPGDQIVSFAANLTQEQIDRFLADPKGPPAAKLLDDATTRIVYDLDAYRLAVEPSSRPPAVAAILARETHASDPVPADGLKIQVAFSYSDGFGREIQKKLQAEPGPVPVRDASGKVIVNAHGQPQMTPDDVDPRWVGSGWTVFNNKGKPVRQYEPFFTHTHRFEFDVRIGLSPVLCYDPPGRVVATLHPNHTWQKVVFDAWRQESWDVNDTVLLDPGADPDVGAFFTRLPNEDYLPTWHTLRTDAAHASAASQRWPDPRIRDAERRAAEKAGVHAATPSVAHADSLGRTFLTIAHNRFRYSNAPLAEEFAATRVVLDIEGNQRAVVDAKDRVVMRYDYDMLGSRVHRASMEAGERWMLNDAATQPLYAWDSRSHRLRTPYDPLRRPTHLLLQEGSGPEIIIGQSFYGESRPSPDADNLRGKVVEVRDQAGIVVTDAYDFKGNLRSSSRQLAQEYRATLNWVSAVPLETDIHTSSSRYDALNRPTELTAPDGSVIRHSYNAANLLERVEANLRGEAVVTRFVNDIDYDAKGQRSLVHHGNGATTTYDYDPLTFRLERLRTRRDETGFPDDCPASPVPGWPGCHVQDLHYTYDPVGNVSKIWDNAQQAIFFRNKRVEPDAAYTYDATYRLIEATGREHLGQAGGSPFPHSYNDAPRVGLLHRGDGQAMGRYIERYVYDVVGNFEEMIHRGTDPAHPGWVRHYIYNEPSLLEPGEVSNRLTSTAIGATPETYSAAGDGYDPHGNMLRMPHLQAMQWDFSDQLQMTSRQAVNADDADGQQHHGERTWYVYDAGGQRVRKVTELSGDQVKDERIYLGRVEIYRRGGADRLVRETLHVMDDQRRVALVETRTQGKEPNVPDQLIRYQFGNHLGSASLELDEQAQIISFEEYTPYGSTVYQAVRSKGQVPKRYQFTGMERDDESGLEYHSARYFMPWLARWVSPDPSGIIDGPNLFLYVNAKPIIASDPSGREEKQTWLMEQKGAEINPIATRTSRGITPFQRLALRVLDKWFGPGTGSNWAHPPDQPFVTQRTGTAVPLRAAPKSENMSKQHESKLAAKAAQSRGQFRRVWDGNHNVDQTVPKGTQIKAAPNEPHVKELAPFAKDLEKLPKIKDYQAPRAKPTSVVKPTSGVEPPSKQLELPFQRGAAGESTPVVGEPPVEGSVGHADGPPNPVEPAPSRFGPLALGGLLLRAGSGGLLVYSVYQFGKAMRNENRNPEWRNYCVDIGEEWTERTGWAPIGAGVATYVHVNGIASKVAWDIGVSDIRSSPVGRIVEHGKGVTVDILKYLLDR
jgi:RHS repeat-associated protein